MADDGMIFIGTSRKPDDSINKKEYMLAALANRHGLVTGATGTGKTISLQILAESFSNRGVPVFCADVKGDLSGLSQPGEAKDFLTKRAKEIGFDDYDFEAFPTIFWDLFGKQGHPIRTTVSEMGPLLLSRMMQLNETQEGVLNIAFKLADDEGLLILDLKDLRSLLAHLSERGDEITTQYGNVATATVGAIQRQLLVLEQQGADQFFGEPALNIQDLMRTTRDGRGAINILAADELMRSPKLYSTFLLWLLSELFEDLPEVGDLDKPKLVFFFDEAHLLFDEAPPALIDKVEQVVKLIRSKGVGVYFVTQNPLDMPDGVLAQLGNRIQHALRAFTPREQKAVKSAAETFRPNPDFDAMDVIMNLAVGEALVSMLEKKGTPAIVERTLIRPPSSRVGPISPQDRQELMAQDPIGSSYDETVDRESAFEVLKQRAEEKAKQEDEQRQAEGEDEGGFFGGGRSTYNEGYRRSSGRSSGRQSIVEAAAKSLTRTVASQLGRALVRGILGSLKSGR